MVSHRLKYPRDLLLNHGRMNPAYNFVREKNSVVVDNPVVDFPAGGHLVVDLHARNHSSVVDFDPNVLAGQDIQPRSRQPRLYIPADPVGYHNSLFG